MFHAVHKLASPINLPPFGGPQQSRLFRELLDTNHDAWRVTRKDRAWGFYREIDYGHKSLPFGSVVLTTEPGKPLTFDFYSGRGKHSLLNTYGDEVAHAAQTLIDREYIISLFTKYGRELSSKNWDHHLSFSGEQVTERSAQLRVGTPAHERIVGLAPPRSSRLAEYRATGIVGMPRHPGLMVSQHEGDVPFVECLVSYPRTIEATFFSSRLRVGLYAITEAMASLVIEHNRSVEGREGFTGPSAW
jgi:hypothetical protein